MQKKLEVKVKKIETCLTLKAKLYLSLMINFHFFNLSLT